MSDYGEFICEACGEECNVKKIEANPDKDVWASDCCEEAVGYLKFIEYSDSEIEKLLRNYR